MNVLVVGAGAVGGFFGVRLAQVGVDVTFLVREQRAKQIQTTGMTVIDAHQDRTSIPVATTLAGDIDGPYDLIIFAVKGAAVEQALTDIGEGIGPQSVILPLLNGNAHMEVLQQRIGRQRLLGGVCLVATQLTENGVIRQLTPQASITFGELDGQASTRVEDIARLLEPADFECAVSTTIVQEMWEKWFFMAAGGASTVLLGGTVGEIAAVQSGVETVSAIIDEAASVLLGADHPVRRPAREFVEAMLTVKGSGFATSLYRDYKAGKVTEVESILGDLVNIGLRHDVMTPLLLAAAVRLRVHNAQVITTSA